MRTSRTIRGGRARRPVKATQPDTSSYDLVLPRNRALRRRLEQKLKEYNERERDVVCKRIILEMLLKYDRVSWGRMERRMGADNPDLFNAFRVIADYIATGGENLTRSLSER